MLSDELAHVVCRHAGERMSILGVMRWVEIGVAIVANMLNLPLDFRITHMLGTFIVSLPYSREHELEADLVGLQLLAKACYTPGKALDVWKRFGESEKGSQPNEFVSTHPSHQHRFEALRQALPSARETFRGSGCKEMHGFRKRVTEAAKW